MKPVQAIIQNENGIVLVVAIFMLALLTMIGMAAMMSSTTEEDIAGNEKFHQMAFYQSESAITVGSELIELLSGYDNFQDYVDVDNFFDTNKTIKVNDLSAFFENRDIKQQSGKFRSGTWSKDNQTEDSIPLVAGSGSGTIDTTPDYELVGSDFCAECDIDKAGTRHMVGGGAEFGSGAEGRGTSSYGVVFNIDCIGRLPAKRSILSEHASGFLYLIE
jgi:hypothetical protein